MKPEPKTVYALNDVQTSDSGSPTLEIVEQARTEKPAVDESDIRIAEALLFASSDPVSLALLEEHVQGDPAEVIAALRQRYTTGGIVLMDIANGYALRTAQDLAYLFEERAEEPKKLSRAALETLAIIAYHQPVTRAEIEDIRGVAASKGTLDVLLALGWIRMRGRRRTPGRPVTYGTTPAFLDQFSLASVGDLPGLDELKGAGLLDALPDANPLPASSGSERADRDADTASEIDDDDAAGSIALWPQHDQSEEPQSSE